VSFPHGCDAYMTQEGARVVRLHYSADPSKDPATPEGAAWKAKAMRGVPLSEWLREMEMDETIAEGDPVFRDFVYERHAPIAFRKKPIPLIPKSTYYVGWDCGMTLRPAVVVAQITPKGQIHFLFELAPMTNMAMGTFAPIVRQKLQERLPAFWQDLIHVGDETVMTKSGSEGRSAYEIAKQSGFKIKRISNNWPQREDAVVWALSDWVSQEGDHEAKWEQRVIYCEQGCPVLVEGMRGAYCLRPSKAHDEAGPGMVYLKPVKNMFSHCLAQGSLVATERGDVPIERVAVGDRVWTRKGLRRVSWSGKTANNAPVLKVLASNGKTVRVTANHLVHADGEFSRADAIQSGMLLSCLVEDPRKAELAQRKYGLAKADSFGIQIRLADRIVSTSKVTWTAGANICTAMFGRNRTGQSQKGPTSTTKTKIAQTTGLKILSAFRRSTISAAGILRNCPRMGRRALLPLVMPQKRGMGPQKELNGIVSMRFAASSGNNLLGSGVAIFAGLTMRPKEMRLGTVPCDVGKGTNAAKGRLEPTERVRFAGTRLRLPLQVAPVLAVNVVRGVSPDGTANVYDLTVDGEHEFFANGILVHNCNDAHQSVLVEVRKNIMHFGQGKATRIART